MKGGFARVAEDWKFTRFANRRTGNHSSDIYLFIDNFKEIAWLKPGD